MKLKLATLPVLFLLISAVACAPLKSIFQPAQTPTPTTIPPLPTFPPVTGTAGQTVPTDGITMADNGKTILMRPGEQFLLNLGMDTYDWSVTVDDQNVLSRIPNILVIRGAQGIYKAQNPGHAILTAQGDPLCRKSKPMCMAPSIIFRITVIVRK